MPTAYEGKKPYIFISYSHADKEEVLNYVDALEQSGFRIWFDGGVEAGSEWPEYIANHLADSACVLAFISPNYVESRNCRSELVLAQNLGKEQLNVYIEKFELSLGMQMQLGLNQAMWRENFAQEEDFVAELCKARMLQNCRENAPEQPDAGTPVAEPPKMKKKKPGNLKAPDEKTIRNCKTLGWLGVLIECAYVPLSVYGMYWMSGWETHGWWMFANMVALHLLLAIVNRILFTPMRKKLKKAGIDKDPLSNAAISVAIMVVLTSVLSAIGGVIWWQGDLNVLWVILIALGLNIVPCLASGLVSLFLAD